MVRVERITLARYFLDSCSAPIMVCSSCNWLYCRFNSMNRFFQVSASCVIVTNLSESSMASYNSPSWSCNRYSSLSFIARNSRTSSTFTYDLNTSSSLLRYFNSSLNLLISSSAYLLSPWLDSNRAYFERKRSNSVCSEEAWSANGRKFETVCCSSEICAFWILICLIDTSLLTPSLSCSSSRFRLSMSSFNRRISTS